VHIAYTPEQEQLRAELRAYFAGLMTPELRDALAGPGGDYGDGTAYREVVRRLGRDGWLAIGWPTEYGGGGRSRLEQLIFMDEAATAGVPVPFLTLDSIGPTIMRHGTPEQRAQYLPRIASGDIHFAIGYSEPDAGTDPDAPRHKGLSILIVPTTAEGFSWTPVRTVAGPTTSATYYSDVRVPASALVGAENEGWALITNQLNHERIALTSAAPLRTALAEVCDWARATLLPDGRRVADQEWVQVHLARVHAKTEFLKLLNWRVASSTADGPGPATASASKVFGTEFAIEAYRLLMEVLGANAYVREGSRGAMLRGRVERLHRTSLILTFGGGTNEVQRDIIAAAGLGLPAARR
jgi:alkylation response protein AidB-like acyl-CoA dehydrogenase